MGARTLKGTISVQCTSDVCMSTASWLQRRSPSYCRAAGRLFEDPRSSAHADDPREDVHFHRAREAHSILVEMLHSRPDPRNHEHDSLGLHKEDWRAASWSVTDSVLLTQDGSRVLAVSACRGAPEIPMDEVPTKQHLTRTSAVMRLSSRLVGKQGQRPTRVTQAETEKSQSVMVHQAQSCIGSCCGRRDVRAIRPWEAASASRAARPLLSKGWVEAAVRATASSARPSRGMSCAANRPLRGGHFDASDIFPGALTAAEEAAVALSC